jgi:hypothetical protein
MEHGPEAAAPAAPPPRRMMAQARGLAHGTLRRLVDHVALAPSYALGAVVARAPRLRSRRAPAEAWVVARVHPTQGGGHPRVWGVRYTYNGDEAPAGA